MTRCLFLTAGLTFSAAALFPKVQKLEKSKIDDRFRYTATLGCIGLFAVRQARLHIGFHRWFLKPFSSNCTSNVTKVITRTFSHAGWLHLGINNWFSKNINFTIFIRVFKLFKTAVFCSSSTIYLRLIVRIRLKSI